MNVKKLVSLFLVLLLVASVTAGCAGKKEDVKDTTQDAAEAQSEEQGFYVTINGTNIQIGMAFADVKDKLGEQTQPEEVMHSCDPDSDWQQTVHYYADAEVTEDKDGYINSVWVKGETASVMGKIKLGTAVDDVKALMGEPSSEDEYSLMYVAEGEIWLSINIENDKVASATIIKME